MFVWVFYFFRWKINANIQTHVRQTSSLYFNVSNRTDFIINGTYELTMNFLVSSWAHIMFFFRKFSSLLQLALKIRWKSWNMFDKFGGSVERKYFSSFYVRNWTCWNDLISELFPYFCFMDTLISIVLLLNSVQLCIHLFGCDKTETCNTEKELQEVSNMHSSCG